MRWWFKKRPKEWIVWRTKVYKRDKYKCVLCGNGHRRLDPHHILPKSEYPKLKYYISNGCTLCRKCHKKTFKKEHEFIEVLVTKKFGGMNKWRLLRHYLMQKNQKTGSKKL